MRKKTIIILGSNKYISNYDSIRRKHASKSKLLIVDTLSKPRSLLPDGAEYLQASPRAISKIEAYCCEQNLTVTTVINMCDYYELMHGKLVDLLGVNGPSYSAVKNLADKSKMHTLMLENDLAFYRPQTILTTLDEVPSHFAHIQFPVVLKTHTGAKSRGVIILKKPEDFQEAKGIIEGCMKRSKKKAVLLEQCLYGKQVSPVMYVDSAGKVHILALVDIITAQDLKQNHMQLIYRTTPSKHTELVRQKIAYVMQTLTNATGLKSTMLHPEFFVNGKHVYLIEVNVRMGGFRSDLMKNAYQIDMHLLLWELARDMPLSDHILKNASSTVCEVWEESSGTLTEFSYPNNKYIEYTKQFVKVGTSYIAPPNAQKPLGQFCLTSPDDSLPRAKRFRSKIKIKLE